MTRAELSYEDNLKRLDRRWPYQEMLSLQDAADYLGIDRSTARKHIQRNQFGKVSKADFARQISAFGGAEYA